MHQGNSQSKPTTPSDDRLEPNIKVETPSCAGTKRRFSDHEAKPDGIHEQQQNADPEENSHSEKRRRSSNWPLPSVNPPSTKCEAGQAFRAASYYSPLQRHRHSHPQNAARPRSSRFVEGSMNDRASHRPPIPYLGPEDKLREKYTAGSNIKGSQSLRVRKFPHHQDQSNAVPPTDRSEVRHSGIYKFGRSIAATFNPSNWRLWSKHQQEDGEGAQRRLMVERQDKAAKIYEELKESGRLGNVPTRASLWPTQDPVSFVTSSSAKHDSGIDFNEKVLTNPPTNREKYRTSREISSTREEKRHGIVFLEPPLINARGVSPVSNISASTGNSNPVSPQKPSFHLKSTSMSNIRRVFASSSATNLSIPADHAPRRIPSRRELQKQQKLVRRVSDLECKLEAAKRQLTEVLGESAPLQSATAAASTISHSRGRPRFVPLPSLPSERLLSDDVDSECEDKEVDRQIQNEIGRAVSVDHLHQSHSSGSSRDTSKSHVPLTASFSNKPLPPDPQVLEECVVPSVEKDRSIDGSPDCSVLSQMAAPECTMPLSSPDPDGREVDQKKPIEGELIENHQKLKSALKKRKIHEDIDPVKKRKTIAPSSEAQENPVPDIMQTPTKKLAFARHADDSDEYKPERDSESQSLTSGSDYDKESPIIPIDFKRPQTSLVASGRKAPTSRKPSLKSIKHTLTSPPPATHRPIKSQISTPPSPAPPSLGSTAPASRLPSTACVNLPYTNPYRSENVEVLGVDDDNEAGATDEYEIPPVPKIPKHIRLVNSDILRLGAHRLPPTHTGEKTSVSEDYEWPEDVF